jgi:phage tail-like protein
MKRQDIEQLLPQVFQRILKQDSILNALLECMEKLHQSPEQALANLDATFNPRRTEDEFVPFLAGWVDLEWVLEPVRKGSATNQSAHVFSTGLGCLRELTANAVNLSKMRGTKEGLCQFLQTATRQSGFRIGEYKTADGQPRLYHIVVYAPENLRPHRALLERITESEKPAHVTYELSFEP